MTDRCPALFRLSVVTLAVLSFAGGFVFGTVHGIIMPAGGCKPLPVVLKQSGPARLAPEDIEDRVAPAAAAEAGGS